MAGEQRQALRPSLGGMISVNLAEQIARAKELPEWKSGDRHAVSLVKDDSLNVVLMMLKRDAHLHEHRTKGPLLLQVLSGSVRFSAGSHERVVAAGELLGLDRDVPHSVSALEDSDLLLVTAIR